MYRKQPLGLRARLANVLPWQQSGRNPGSKSSVSSPEGLTSSPLTEDATFNPDMPTDARVTPMDNHPNFEVFNGEVGDAAETAPEAADSTLVHSQGARQPFWGWPWLIGFTASALTGAVAFLWLSRLPSLPNCSPSVTAETGGAGLYCTKEAVEDGNLGVLLSALEKVSQWPQDDPLASQANYLANEWSRIALVIARQKMKAGDLPGAMKLARKIPQSTTVYSEAQANIQSWEQDWQQGQKGYETAQVALKDQNWSLASDQIKQLAQIDSTYWRDRVEDLIEQIAAEKQAWGRLRQAQRLAETALLDDLAAAIRRARQVPTDSYAGEQAKTEIEQWSQDLLKLAEAALADQDWERAIAAAEGIPRSSDAFPKAEDLVQLGQAQTLAEQDRLGAYLHAWALAQQIPPNRPLYEPARLSVTQWESQIQNLGQLQVARWFASLDERLAYELAIDFAEMVEVDQPRRSEAQTLVAHWRNQVETLADRHFLAQARGLALAGTLDSLRAAIAVAGKIDLGRALRLDAQTLIAEWQAQTERIRDQPILDQARNLARQGQLQAAIDQAAQIDSERALYPEAQAAIDGWVRDIQTSQDRPLLQEAIALANQGSLSEAIALAGQIGYDRALYYEAQDYIARWISERDAVETARSAPAEPTPEPASEPLNEDLEVPLDVQPFELEAEAEPEIETPPSPPEPEPTRPPRTDPSRLAPRNQGPPVIPGSE